MTLTDVHNLTRLDGAFLSLETPTTPIHVGSLHMFETPPGYRKDCCDAIRQMAASRLHLAPVLRRRMAQMLLHFANPVWIEGDMDLQFHVGRVTLAQLEHAALPEPVVHKYRAPMVVRAKAPQRMPRVATKSKRESH